MKKLIFATNNQNKVAEVKNIIGERFEVVSLKDAGIEVDIPEPHATLQENAKEKSYVIHRMTGENCFSEDTGLEVDALGGEPGVNSARYAGEAKNSEDNIDKLLQLLDGVENRRARFRTVISLVLNNTFEFFEGVCEGNINKVRKGNGGFGYDSIFQPVGSMKTFGEMDMNEKKKFSHRKKATDQLASFLSYFGKK